MTRTSIGRSVIVAIVAGALGYAAPPAIAKTHGGATRVSSAATTGEAAAAKGRYKKEGDTCVWDANDDGPNQCTPRTAGRFKKEGNTCVWSMSDLGPDQCRPPKGRFKVEGDHCVWTANDSGPDQCNPRQPR
jgi:hypothetical protein